MEKVTLYINNMSGQELYNLSVKGASAWSPHPPQIMSNNLMYGPIYISGGSNFDFIVCYEKENHNPDDLYYGIQISGKTNKDQTAPTITCQSTSPPNNQIVFKETYHRRRNITIEAIIECASTKK